MTDDLHRDYNLNMSRVETVRCDLAGLQNRMLDFLGGQILRLYGVKVEEPEATKGTPSGCETATASSATETHPPDVEKPS